MPVQHKDTCVSGTNPVQCAYYNKDHKIVNMLGYELIEEKELPPGTTTCSFNGLDGNEDEEYFIESIINVVSNGSDKAVSIQPNGISSNQAESNLYSNDFTGSSGNSSSVLPIGFAIFSENSFNNFKCYLDAKLGRIRRFSADGFVKSTNHFSNQHHQGYWNETVTNITSLIVVITSGGSFSGIIRLWKRIPLDGGD